MRMETRTRMRMRMTMTMTIRMRRLIKKKQVARGVYEGSGDG